MFNFGGRACVDPLDLYESFVEEELPTDLFAGKANSFTVRPDDTPSSGYVLMRQADLDLVAATSSNTLNITDQASHTLRFVGLYVVSAVRVAGGPAADGDSVYLVEFADDRIRRAMVPISAAYNVRPAAGGSFYSATRNGGSDWTWTTMTTAIWNAVTGLGTFPGFPASPFALPASAPENFNFYGGYALSALVAVLNRLGCRLRLDNTTGLYSIVQIGGGNDTTYYQSWESAGKKFDGLTRTPDPTNRPEKVRVTFHRIPAPTAGTDPYYAVDVALSASTGVLAGSVAVIEDDLAALGATGAPSNAAALATRAAERAADWERRYTKANKAKTVQYREYLSAARLAVGERRDAAVFEDRGDGYTTESFSVTSRLYEALRFGFDTTASAGLATQNTDGTEVGTSTDMRFDKATGIQIVQGGGGFDTVSVIAASPSQAGAVTTSLQAFEGEKRFFAAVRRTEVATGTGTGYTPFVVMDISGSTAVLTLQSTGATTFAAINSVFSGTTGGTTIEARAAGYGVVTNAINDSSVSAYADAYTQHRTGRTIAGTTVAMTVGGLQGDSRQGISFATSPAAPTFDIYADTAVWTAPDSGPLRCRVDMIWNSGTGPILISPDGNLWRLGVSNAGALTITGPL